MYQYKAKAERVVDGNTFDVTIDLGFKINTHQRIRLAGIITPETYSVKKDSEEYKKGLASTEFVEKRLADSEVSLNEESVDKGFAVWAVY